MSNLIEIESSYWWHVSKRNLVMSLMSAHCPGGKVLECGVGGGKMLSVLKQAGYSVSGFEISEEAVLNCHRIGIPDVAIQDISKPWPVEEQSFNAIVMLDVLEHCQYPIDVLLHARRALKPDGVLVMTVPARPELMGPWDEMLGHYRRYDTKLLEEQATAADFQINWLSAWNAFSLPIAYFLRFGQKFINNDSRAEFPRVSPFVNSTLITIADWERKIIASNGLPIGLSLAAVLRPTSKKLRAHQTALAAGNANVSR